jgi:hypothetical protein
MKRFKELEKIRILQLPQTNAFRVIINDKVVVLSL